MKRIRIPQPIPGEICLTCDVCCRFPERDSFLSPFFTEEETRQAIRLWKGQVNFRPIASSAGGQVVPIPWEHGCRCPFFDPEAHICHIYRERPLDCQLYPYALMLDPSSCGVWLGIDTKCPATDDPDLIERLVASAPRIWEASMSDDLIEVLEQAPRIIGPYQPDVLPLFRLETLTASLLSTSRLIPWRSPVEAFSRLASQEETRNCFLSVQSPRALTLADRTILERCLGQNKPRLAGQSFAIQYLASDLMDFVACELEGFFCVWAFDNGTVYMPLPPMGSGEFHEILSRCFAFMDKHNAAPEISRIESLGLSDLPKGSLTEFQIRPGYPDYIYRGKDLVELRGRRFRGKRSDCRAFAKSAAIKYRPYGPADEQGCLALFKRWQSDRLRKVPDGVARKLLEDTVYFHRRALKHGKAIGLIGRVICVGGSIVAYTFGFPLNEDTFVVVLEATDPAYRGASAYIFREFARELEAYRYINAMDDSGLPGLRRLKRSYRPWRLEPSFVLYRR